MELNVLFCSIFHFTDLLEAAKSNELFKNVNFFKKDDVDTNDENGVSLLMSVSINENQQM